jgi:hypothetical protein
LPTGRPQRKEALDLSLERRAGRPDHLRRSSQWHALEVTVRDGVWSWTPAGPVVVVARADLCGTDYGSFEVMCPYTVFHSSPKSARAWLAGHGGLDAEILDQEAAIEYGRLNFGTLPTGPV